MSKTLLTIDWDYFIDASLEVRDNIFPRVTEGFKDSVPDNSLWNEVPHPTYGFDLLSFERLHKAFYNGAKNTDSSIPVYYSENHCEAYYAFIQSGADYNKLINVDFHHDMGIEPQLSCDDWARRLTNDYPVDYYWVNRVDSVTTCFGVEVPAKILSFDDLLTTISEGKIDAIHICRSDLYSPPPYDAWFNSLLSELSEIYWTKPVLLGTELQKRC